MDDLILEDSCGCKHIIHDLGEHSESLEKISVCKTAQCRYEDINEGYLNEDLEMELGAFNDSPLDNLFNTGGLEYEYQ